MNTVPIVSFNELEPAQKFRDRLLRAGIEARITDESKTEKFWFMSDPLAAIHVEVAEEDFTETATLIKSLGRLEGGVAGAVQCPECASTRVEYPQTSRKFYTPRFSSFLLALNILPREFYCQDCHYTWPAVPAVEPECDLLGWPKDSKLWHPENTPKVVNTPTVP
jgi:hypothetical protein